MYPKEQLERKVKQKEIKFAIKLKSFPLIRGILGNGPITALSRLAAKAEMLVKLENVNKKAFFRRKLAIFPDLSEKLRIQILVVSVLTDKLCIFVFILIGK